MRRMKFFGKIAKYSIFFVLPKPGKNTPFDSFENCPFKFAKPSCFLHILNSPSLLWESAEWQEAHEENAQNEIKHSNQNKLDPKSTSQRAWYGQKTISP